MSRTSEQMGGDKSIVHEQIGGSVDYQGAEPASEESAEPPSDSDVPERILLAKAIQGDKRAWLDMVDLLRMPLYRSIYRFTRNADLADDLTQETLLKIYEKITQFRLRANTSSVHGSLLAWAKQIAWRVCLDDWRTKKRRPTETLNEEYEGNFLEGAPDFTESIVLWRVLDILPTNEKLAVRLYFEQECTLHEIAEMLHAPLSTINARIRRALKRLRKAMSEEAPPTNPPPLENQPENRLENQQEKHRQKTSPSNLPSHPAAARPAKARGGKVQSDQQSRRSQSRSKSTEPGNQDETGGDTE